MGWPIRVLCYPTGDEECVLRRERILRDAGVVELLSEGPYEIDGFKVLGRGHSAVVVAALLRSGDVAAAKILRADSKRDDLMLECSLLKKGIPITPKPLYCFPELIIMELIRGIPLKMLQRRITDCDTAVLTALKVIGAAHYLDRVGINHKELSDPTNHVFITVDGRVKILDLETASVGHGCNVCRILSWVIMRSHMLEPCTEGRKLSIEVLQPQLRRYKGGDRSAILPIMRHLNAIKQNA
ncbi:MAG: hypothetical protein J7L55_04605 [Desulfurococcales archaeon]|nr:hypothetical protein [Desulfurococcales archaeon]